MSRSRSPIVRSFDYALAAFRRRRRPARRQQCLARAAFEGLESRLMLSTYQVTSLADVASSDPGYTGTLRWAIQKANTDGAAHKAADTITFASGLTGTITLTQGALSLTAGNTTIKGPGSTTLSVNGAALTSVFQVNSGVTASISGLTITDGESSTNGGGIDSLGTLTVTNDVFSEDSAGAGGGIYSSGKLTVTGCTFSGDSSVDGGAISNYGKATITSSSFTDDTAAFLVYGLGGGIDNYGTLSINNCTFTDDFSATLEGPTGGGGIANEAGASATITNSTFFQDSNEYIGGAIYNDAKLTVTGCTFTDDTADNGAAIYNDTAGKATISNSTFTDDQAGVSDDGDGGGIDNFNALVISCCTFSSDTASDNGGGIANELGGTATVNGSTFSYDSADDGGGIANAYGGTLNVSTTCFSNDSSIVDGGGIYNDGKLCVSCCTFSDDAAGQLPATEVETVSPSVAIGGADGGAIDNDVQGTATITSTTFTYDSTGDGSGGAIYNAQGASLNISSCTFNTNDAIQNGGSIYNDGQLTVTRSTFTGDLDDGAGAGIYNDSNGTGKVSQCTFSDETSYGSSGGGIWNSGTFTISACTFSTDSAAIAGGGVGNSGTLSLNNSTLSGNTSEEDGGGIYNNGTLTATNCTLANNEAEDLGGGIYVASGDITIYNTIVADNYLSDGVTPSDIFGALDQDLVAGQPPSSNNMIGAGGSGGLLNGIDGNIVLTSDSSADLGPLKNNGGPTQTIALLTGSPAINTGSVALAKAASLTTDQRGSGYSRIIKNKVDIGAYQIQK